MTSRALVVAACLLGTTGCSGSAVPPLDGGPPRLLEAVSPIQLGLQYGESVDLEVRYRLDDTGHTPLVGQAVRFAVFGDPGGSTLAADHIATDEDGLASVRLTAGSQEGSFRVRASAPGAADLEIGVAVSRLEFANIDVVLAYTGPATVGQYRAALYTTHDCAGLPPPELPGDYERTLTQPGGPVATLSFQFLLSRDYAIVGRAEDPAGHLVAAGCVDLAQALLPSGTSARLPLPLEPVQASVLGTYQLATTLTVKPALAQAATAPWHALADCPSGAAEPLLDRIAAQLPSSLADAIRQKRGAADDQGCRPTTLSGGAASLDAQLASLLAAGPASQLAAIAADLTELTAEAELASTLTVAAAGAGRYSGEHALATLTLGTTAKGDKTYSLPASALPIVEARDVAIGYDGRTLTIGEHGFTLGLGTFWKRALGELSIGPRVPQASPSTALGLLQAVVAAATKTSPSGQKTGCAAVEELICATTGASGCAGAVTPACTSGVTQLASGLEAAFAPPTELDFQLSGYGTAFDSTGNLQVDRIQPGGWTTPLAQNASFTGSRAVP